MLVPTEVPQTDWAAVLETVRCGLLYVGRGSVNDIGGGTFVCEFDSTYPRHFYMVTCALNVEHDQLEIYLTHKRTRFDQSRRSREIKSFFDGLTAEVSARLPADCVVKELSFSCSKDFGYAECYATIERVSDVAQNVLFEVLEDLRAQFDDVIPLIKLARKKGGGLVIARLYTTLALDASIVGEEH